MTHPWGRHIFSLIMPDAFSRQVAGAIVERMGSAGFVVSYASLVRVAPEQLDEVNATNIKHHWDSYRYRLLDRLFGFGPVLALIYEDRSGRTEDAHARVKQLKGATDPRLATAGTIRRDLGGINAMLALVHAADTPARSLLEARLFLGDAVVETDAPPPGTAVAGTDSSSCQIVLALLAASPPERRGFDDVLHGHRAQILAAAWADLTPAGRSLAQDALGLGDAVGRVGLADDAIGPKLAEALRAGPLHPAYDLLRVGWQPGLGGLTERDLRRGQAALELPTDPWADLVLLTSAQFAPRREKVSGRCSAS